MVEEFDREQFGKRLIEIMEERRINCTSLAIWIGTTISVVSTWRCGRSIPYLKSLVPVCGILDVSSDWLIGLSDNKTRLGCLREFDKRLFQTRLIDTMTKKHITYKALIDAMDSNSITIWSWRTGQHIPGTDSLFRLCQALDVSSDWMLGLRDDNG